MSRSHTGFSGHSVLSINGGTGGLESHSKRDIEEYRRLAGPCRRSLRHDKNQWAEQVACAGENHLLGEIKDVFANFRQLRQKYVTLSAPLKKKKKYCPSRSEVDLSRFFQVGLNQIVCNKSYTRDACKINWKWSTSLYNAELNEIVGRV